MLSLSSPTSSYEAVRKIFSICQVRVTDILLPAQLGDSAAGPVHQTALVRRDFISTRDDSPKVLLIQIKPDPLLLLEY